MREDRKLANFAVGKPAYGERLGVGANWNSNLTTSPKCLLLNDHNESILRSFRQGKHETIVRKNLLYLFLAQVHSSSIRCKPDFVRNLRDPTNSIANSPVHEPLGLSNRCNQPAHQSGNVGGGKTGTRELRKSRFR
jgi:hypothetical protein